MTAGPYCQWCGQNVCCAPNCPGPPTTVEMEVAILHDGGKTVARFPWPANTLLPGTLILKVTDPDILYYDGRGR